MKRIFLINLIFFIAIVSSAQKNTSVILTTTGSGSSRDLAINNALKQAVEQSFGTFVTTKTNVSNDTLLSDEILTVSNGKIVHYEILNESEFDKNKVIVTLNVTVSLNELVNFVQAKGGSVEIKGALLANNYILLDLYKNNEISQSNDYFNTLIKAIENKKLFDTKLDAIEPFKISSESFAVPMHLTINGNAAMASVASNAINFLKSISINEKNLDLYKKINLDFYTLILNDGKDNIILYFRDQSTIKQLDKLYDFLRVSIKNIDISNGFKNKKLINFGKFTYEEVEADKIGLFNFKKYNNHIDELFQNYAYNLKSGKSNHNEDPSKLIYYDLFFSLYDLGSGFFNTVNFRSYGGGDKDLENRIGILFVNDFRLFKIAGEFKKIKNVTESNKNIFVSNPGLLTSEKLQLDIFLTDILDLNTLKNTSKYTVQ